MYKVFKDDIVFFLSDNEHFSLETDYPEILLKKPQEITKRVNNSEKSTVFMCKDKTTEMITCFEDNIKIKLAAGGWIFNSKGELLMIKRWGKWDLPKGHLEKGEHFEECAIREVEEETGVKNINLGEKLGISRHIFQRNNQNRLKVTHWYKMNTDYNGALIPQTEEDIEDVKWVKANEIETHLKDSWKSLRDFYFDYLL